MACVLPFIYAGVTYSECTTAVLGTPWCATSTTFTSLSSTDWGYCHGQSTTLSSQLSTELDEKLIVKIYYRHNLIDGCIVITGINYRMDYLFELGYIG